MKKIITILLLLCFTNMASYAVNFDASIDEKIRQNYDVEANEKLPALPSFVPTAKEASTQTYQVNTTQTTKYNPTGKTYTLKSGTKIKLVSNRQITDWTAKGSIVSFTSTTGFTAKDGTIIPAGTIFKGKITDSHPPQITGNGGLIELCIDEIYFNGIKSPIETKISLANSKKIFLSNIKGERKYWKNFSKAMKPGTRFFSATRNCAAAMAVIPVVNILSIVPFVGGATVYAVNAVVAPVIAIFTKGGNIALPSGTEFQIKLTKDSEIRG